MDTQNQQSSAPEGAQKLGAPSEKNTLMGVLSYVGILVIVPFIVAKDDPFVKFHIKQGVVLVVIEAIAWVIGMTMFPLIFLTKIIDLAALVLSIVGIVNVVKGFEKELPFVGKYSKYVTF